MPAFVGLSAALQEAGLDKKPFEEVIHNFMDGLPEGVVEKLDAVMETCSAQNWDLKAGRKFAKHFKRAMESTDKPKIIFSFRSDVLVEVEAIAKELQAVNVDAHAINDYDNYRLHWTTNAKRSMIGICVQYDRNSYVKSSECAKEMGFLEGRAKHNKMLLFKIGKDLWEHLDPTDVAIAIFIMIAGFTKALEEEDVSSSDDD